MKKFPSPKCQVVITLVEIVKKERFQLKTHCSFQKKKEDLDLQAPNQISVLAGYWACHLKQINSFKIKINSLIKTEETLQILIFEQKMQTIEWTKRQILNTKLFKEDQS